ncbi:MAG: glycoside hydrolase family 127 protein, partial [Parabacteroides sp.]|nr:glycoside hydrolase family 127 protein [Parabacteroides sp.]
TWSEPCAIVDSYLLAFKLWEHTGKLKFLEDAHLIWYNAICHAQRANGGFGCDACPGEASGPDIRVRIEEAHWCCSMRGAEGLATAVKSLAYSIDGSVYLTGFHEGVLLVDETQLKISSDYPFSGKLELEVLQGKIKADQLKIFIPHWMKLDTQKPLEDGFLVVDETLREGEKLVVSYSFEPREESCINVENTSDNVVRKLVGPLVLDEFDKPIYHIMNKEVSKTTDYRRRILHQK